MKPTETKEENKEANRAILEAIEDGENSVTSQLIQEANRWRNARDYYRSIERDDVAAMCEGKAREIHDRLPAKVRKAIADPEHCSAWELPRVRAILHELHGMDDPVTRAVCGVEDARNEGERLALELFFSEHYAGEVAIRSHGYIIEPVSIHARNQS